MMQHKTKSSDLRIWDQMEVRVVCEDSGLRRTYEGRLYFIGSETTVMVGPDEILCECIKTIEPLVKVPSIGWSEFARKHSAPESGNSYTLHEEDHVVQLVKDNWVFRKPGTGETTLDRKVLVPILRATTVKVAPTSGFYLPDRMPLKEGMNVHARVVTRQAGEDPYIENFVLAHEAKKLGWAPTPAKSVEIVCYSAEALEDNGGKRSTDCDWEIVAVLCHGEENEPMLPLTMARNFLEKPGGTKSVYTALEFAEAVYYHATRKGVKVMF